MKWYLTPDNREFSQWKPQAIAKHLGNVSLPVNEPLAKLSVGVNTLYPLVDDGSSPEPYQTAIRTITVGADTATATYTYENKPLADYKAERIAEVAQKKWEVETGGVTVNGSVIDTSERSQGLINGAYNLALRKQNEPDFTINFRGSNGWVTLDANTMIAIGEAVGLHVQASFDRYRELEEAIDAASNHAEVSSIDITTGWPT